MSIGIQNQKFGVEFEFYGITRSKAADILAAYFGTQKYYGGTSYDKYCVDDPQGRTWTIMRDASVASGSSQSCELVTPVCEYKDIEDIQQIVRDLAAKGIKVGTGCGIHIHIDGANHDAKSIRNLALIIASKEAPMITALQIKSERLSYCKPTDKNFAEWLDKHSKATLPEIKEKYYEGTYSSRSQHYSSTRYHMLNLHSFFGEYYGCHHTVEFRCFNSTTHAGRVKAYIQFCLAVSAQAINQTTARYKPMDRSNDAYVFRTWLNRAKLIGKEYRTCQYHMLYNLQGDRVYHDRANVRHRTEHFAQTLNARIIQTTEQTAQPERTSIAELPTAPQERPDVPSFSILEQCETFIQTLYMLHHLTSEDRSDMMNTLTRGLNETQREELFRTFSAANPERNIEQTQTQTQTQTTQRTARRAAGGE